MKKPRKIVNRPEQDLQIAIMSHVNTRAHPGAFAFHVPNAGKRSYYVAKKLKQMGLRAGVPDLIIVYRGTMHCLELKDGAKGKRSADQITTMNALEVAGARCATAHTLDEALYTLEFWGVLKRNHNPALRAARPSTSEAA